MGNRKEKIDDYLLNKAIMEENKEDLSFGGNDFDYCVKLFLDDLELKNLAYNTRRWHKENLHYIKQALEKLKLSTEPVNIADKDFKQCILYWKRDCNLSPTSINHRIRSFRQFYMYLNSERIVLNCPYTSIEKLKGPKVIIKPFEKDDLEKLFKQPDRTTFVGFRDYTMVLVFLDTGVRLCEIASMRTDDLDLSNNKILVLGKGAKEREVMFEKTTRQYLQRYLIFREKPDTDYLWITDMGTPLNRRSIQQRLKHYGKAAGITKVRVSPHTFRHTCAKLYIKRGGDVLSLQKLLGHSSLDMVKLYVSLWGTDLQQMHKKYSPVEGLFDPLKGPSLN